MLSNQTIKFRFPKIFKHLTIIKIISTNDQKTTLAPCHRRNNSSSDLFKSNLNLAGINLARNVSATLYFNDDIN